MRAIGALGDGCTNKSLAKGHQAHNLLKRLHGAGARKTSACVHPSRCSLWINMVSQEGDGWLVKLALGGIDINSLLTEQLKQLRRCSSAYALALSAELTGQSLTEAE